MTERTPTRLSSQQSRAETLRLLVEALTPHVERDEALAASGLDMEQVLKDGRATRATTLNLGQRMLFAALKELDELTGEITSA